MSRIVRVNLHGTGALLFLIGVLLLVGLVFGLFIRGGAWLAGVTYPWLRGVSELTLAVSIVIFLPMSLFARARVIAGNGIIIASYIFGLTLWVWGFLLTYTLWGTIALIIGLIFLGIGVVPIAMLATLFNGMWATLGELIGLTILTFGARAYGFRLLERATREQLERM
jgi:hypothetical protein